MTITRRDLLLTSGVSLLGGAARSGQGAAPSRAQQQARRSRKTACSTRFGRIRLPLTMSNGRPAGRGWDWLVQQARDAHFTLIGEEHGVAETAQLSAALFKALRGSGYSRMAIELSPIIAQDIEAAARRNGLQGILDFFAAPQHLESDVSARGSAVPRDCRQPPRRRTSACSGDSTARSSAIAI